jgi:hypothetical protein
MSVEEEYLKFIDSFMGKLEMLAAAYIKTVGIPATEVKLIMRQDGNKTSYWFERKTEEEMKREH